MPIENVEALEQQLDTICLGCYKFPIFPRKKHMFLEVSPDLHTIMAMTKFSGPSAAKLLFILKDLRLEPS